MRRLLVPVLLVALTACSGGGDDAPSLEDRRKAYIADAEDVCAQTNEDVRALGTPSSVAEVPAAADRAVEIVRQTVDRVSALEPPPEDADELREKVLDPLRADVGVAEEYAGQLKQAAAAGDGAALLRLVQERPQTSADLAFMREYGFVDCVAAADQRD